MMGVLAKINWQIVGLLLLGSISIVSGAFQLDVLQQGLLDQNMQRPKDSLHYFNLPLPIIAHIVAGVAFNILAPMQFSHIIRSRFPNWHKYLGRGLVFSVLIIGVTGIVMNQIYPFFGGFLKYSAVLFFAIGIIVSATLGVISIKKGRIQQHRKWMIYTTAFALGPATQRLFFIPAFLILGEVNELTVGIGVWAGFLINLFFARWIIAKKDRLSKDVADTEGLKPLTVNNSV